MRLKLRGRAGVVYLVMLVSRSAGVEILLFWGFLMRFCVMERKKGKWCIETVLDIGRAEKDGR